MIDREKVIKGLEKLRKDLGYGLPDRSNVVVEYLNSLTGAIELLKELGKDRLEIAHEMISGSILMYKGKELVRCKDCKHWDEKKNECHNVHSYMQYRPCFGNWFCADGEKAVKQNE